MISFVNAKLNIGLYITRRRPDGYHDLETLFYPVGLYDGTPVAPEGGAPFCDILEITPSETAAADRFMFLGRKVDCPPEKNLVCRAVSLFRSELAEESAGAGVFSRLPEGVDVTLIKNLPDGAGLGGGSADASFTLRLLNELTAKPFSAGRLEEMALRLGADCPFFIRNRPAFASGVGDLLEESSLSLAGRWAVVAKPHVYVSTREAFANISPRPASFDLRRLGEFAPSEWRGLGVANQFEETLFPLHPVLADIKQALYDRGAEYASMSGSGAALYGIFPDEPSARVAFESMPSTLEGVWLLKL
ncbi:MAG: 4-(cytidine 5'-diphospho)-2-C-methyl-D-erythritol kinase [Bacteroidales bacterium]|nr:4-(cytidine 5'-diphospho)-2-C-methyl-D-erythritol kinase [Bacteroidales bacterium]